MSFRSCSLDLAGTQGGLHRVSSCYIAGVAWHGIKVLDVSLGEKERTPSCPRAAVLLDADTGNSTVGATDLLEDGLKIG
jgi:hypothetical protein